MDEIFENIIRSENTQSSSLECVFDSFTCAFLTKDNNLIYRLFTIISSKLSDSNFQQKIIRIWGDKLREEYKSILKRIKQCEKNHRNDAFYRKQLEALNIKLQIETLDDYLNFEKDILYNHDTLEILNNEYSYLNDTDGERYIKQNYHLYSIGKILFDHFKQKVSRKNKLEFQCNKELVRLYKNINIDIESDDQQFSKYNLLSTSENFKIYCDKDNQIIIDKRLNTNFFVGTPRPVLNAFQELIKLDLIKSISFKVEAINEGMICLEERDFGSIFNLDLLELPDLSKFYSIKRPDNNLWVSVDKNKSSITFEETLEDFETIEDVIITQVIHLEYFTSGKEYFISHIDHEYIKYDINAYADRVSQQKIKGHSKVKTFKIDNSKIPFKYEYKKKILIFLILDSYFENKELLKEYFNPILINGKLN